MGSGTKKFEKLSREEKISLMFDLINSFTIVEKPFETALFLQDLLTANEIRNLSIRLRIAKLLIAGMTHREIMEEVHTSFATVAKVSSWLDRGGEGFKNVISKLPLKWKIPKDLPRGPIEFHLPQTIFALAQYGVAKSQDIKTERFLKNVTEKKIDDRVLEKWFDEYYKERALERKSLERRKGFFEKISKSGVDKKG